MPPAAGKAGFRLVEPRSSAFEPALGCWGYGEVGLCGSSVVAFAGYGHGCLASILVVRICDLEVLVRFQALAIQRYPCSGFMRGSVRGVLGFGKAYGCFGNTLRLDLEGFPYRAVVVADASDGDGCGAGVDIVGVFDGVIPVFIEGIPSSILPIPFIVPIVIPFVRRPVSRWSFNLNGWSSCFSIVGATGIG